MAITENIVSLGLTFILVGLLTLAPPSNTSFGLGCGYGYGYGYGYGVGCGYGYGYGYGIEIEEEKPIVSAPNTGGGSRDKGTILKRFLPKKEEPIETQIEPIIEQEKEKEVVLDSINEERSSERKDLSENTIVEQQQEESKSFISKTKEVILKPFKAIGNFVKNIWEWLF